MSLIETHKPISGSIKDHIAADLDHPTNMTYIRLRMDLIEMNARQKIDPKNLTPLQEHLIHRILERAGKIFGQIEVDHLKYEYHLK